MEGFPKELVITNPEGVAVCRHFNEAENKCSIYRYRPLICNVDKLFYVQTRTGGPYPRMTKKNYYNMQLRGCVKLQAEFGIEDKFKVTLN